LSFRFSAGKNDFLYFIRGGKEKCRDRGGRGNGRGDRERTRFASFLVKKEKEAASLHRWWGESASFEGGQEGGIEWALYLSREKRRGVLPGDVFRTWSVESCGCHRHDREKKAKGYHHSKRSGGDAASEAPTAPDKAGAWPTFLLRGRQDALREGARVGGRET